nr:hypothetical protein Itr_chr13CG15190 [Ipomoea trifida]
MSFEPKDKKNVLVVKNILKGKFYGDNLMEDMMLPLRDMMLPLRDMMLPVKGYDAPVKGYGVLPFMGYGVLPFMGYGVLPLWDMVCSLPGICSHYGI